MERVAFLIEETGERIGCLLNPDSLVIRRSAGVQPRRSAGGQLSGAGLGDDPLLYTGGGKTELEIDLLFDVSLADSTIATDDVRDLTRPLANLAENTASRESIKRPPLVRFVWGKSWNIPGIVAAVAERFEQFSAGGAPQRSWLRMRLLRVGDPTMPLAQSGNLAGGYPEAAHLAVPISVEDLEIPEEQISVHEIIGGGEGERASGDRLDEIAAAQYGDPAYWRLLAAFNDLDDPLHLTPGTALRIPPGSALRSGS
jgi:hypothetical protein